MRELSDVMHEALEQRSHALRDVTLDDARLGTLRSRVRRRRALRHTAEAAVAVPVAAALAFGGYWLVTDRPAPVPPVETPVVTPTPSPEPTEEPEPDDTPTSTPDATIEEPPDDSAGETPEAIPAGFPDPETLVGQDAHDERRPDGTQYPVVGGEPIDLTYIFGARFAGDTGDVCGYAISASGPGGADGVPEPSGAALLLLLRSTGSAVDGTPTWRVLDATITRTSAPTVLEYCEGEEGIAFYPAGDAVDFTTVPVAAAWGPNDDFSALVELDPSQVTCAYLGH